MVDTTLVKALQNPALYQHEVEGFDILETHISWVILTGSYAYKIKKPVNFGFLDFTTFDKRRHFCQLEVELNRRLAPDLYIEALPIFGTAKTPSLQANGQPIDYAIKMRQFKQENLLLSIAREGKLNDIMIQDIARQLALFHRKAKEEISSEFGSPDAVYQPVDDNFTTLKSLDCAKAFLDDIQKISQWAQTEYERLQPLLATRKKNGFIRACHGDLHLGNIVLFSGKPLIFDCIEFNDDFRIIDVMNDIAFLSMDLKEKGYSAFANLLINTYAEWSNDYEGLALVDFYECYRAMVRAKVSALQLDSFEAGHPMHEQLKNDLQSFIALAKSSTQAKHPKLTITFGPSGSGKSVYSKQYMMDTHAIRLRSDVCRKHLYQLPPFKTPSEEIKVKLYSKEASEKTFDILYEHTQMLLENQCSVIVDATFIQRAHRDRFISLGKACGVPIEILHFDIPIDELKANIKKRQHAKLNPSDADLDVMLKQLDNIDPLSEDEQKYAKKIHHADIVDMIS